MSAPGGSPMSPSSTEMPVRHHMQSSEWYEGIDPGIVFAVRVLHAHGIDTGQSCEGGEGHCYDHPTVDLGGTSRHDAAGFAALHALTSYALPVRTIEYVWYVEHGAPFESFWRITFRHPLHDMADRQPSFIQHYQWNEACS